VKLLIHFYFDIYCLLDKDIFEEEMNGEGTGIRTMTSCCWSRTCRGYVAL